MREPFGANAGISKNAQYAMIAVLIAVAVIGGIHGATNEREATESAASETSKPVQ